VHQRCIDRYYLREVVSEIGKTVVSLIPASGILALPLRVGNRQCGGGGRLLAAARCGGRNSIQA